jgi:hypothetical protein
VICLGFWAFAADKAKLTRRRKSEVQAVPQAGSDAKSHLVRIIVPNQQG